MLNTILTTSMFVSLFAGSARADVQVTYQIDFAMKGGAQAARYSLYVADHGCGELEIKTGSRASSFRVCAIPADQKRVKLEVSRRTRDHADETRTQAVVVAASGASFDLLDAKMTVKSL